MLKSCQCHKNICLVLERLLPTHPKKWIQFFGLQLKAISNQWSINLYSETGSFVPNMEKFPLLFPVNAQGVTGPTFSQA